MSSRLEVGHSSRAIGLIALAALALLPACRRAEEPPPPDIRPVRVISVELRAAGDVVFARADGVLRQWPVVALSLVLVAVALRAAILAGR